MGRLVATGLAGLLTSGFLMAEEVPIRLTAGRAVLVPVLVNGQGPYEFLLDTGSTTTLIDRKLTKELGLGALGETVIRTATGTERVAIARLDRLGLGSRSERTVLVLCSRLEGIRSLDGAIRGVLGINFLSRFPYLLDYAGKRFSFGDDLPRGGLPLTFDAGQRSIVLEVNGLRLLLDTGATGLILFDFDGLDIEVNPRAPRRVSTNEGQRVASSGWLRRLEVGDVSFERLPVTLLSRTGLEDRADGLLPGAIFDSIYFDHPSRLVVVNPVRSGTFDPPAVPSLP